MQRLSAERKPNKNRTKPDIGKLLTAVAAGIFVVSLVLSLWIFRPSDEKVVEILSDGEVIYTFDLTTTKNQEFTVIYQGSSNTVKIEDGEIWVQRAQCPDQTCVKMGKLYSESLPIVCMPNRLTIRYAE